MHRIRSQGVGTFAGEERFSTVTVDDSEHGPLATPAPGRKTLGSATERRDLDATGGAHCQTCLDRGARVVGVNMHRVVARTRAAEARRGDRDGVAQLIQAGAQRLHVVHIAIAEQIHHLESG